MEDAKEPVRRRYHEQTAKGKNLPDDRIALQTFAVALKALL